MTTANTDEFRALHVPGMPFVLANAWDAGSAHLISALGFPAVATTSAGFALTLGRRDYRVSREEAIEHGRVVSAASSVPVSADLENGFGADVESVTQTIREASSVGLAGGSIEDTSGDDDAPILDLATSVARIEAAVAEARQTDFVLTARADGLLHGTTDLAEIIERLVAFEAAGADVVYAPGLSSLDDVARVCSSVSAPVNVLYMPSLGGATLADLAGVGVARVSIGGALAYDAYSRIAAVSEDLQAGRFDSIAPDGTAIGTMAKLLM